MKILRRASAHGIRLARGISLCLLGWAMVGGVRADTWWQLTFRYDASGLDLVSAAPMAARAGGNLSADLETAPVKLGYVLEWRDAAGKGLLQTPVEIPLGLRSSLANRAEPLAHETIIPQNGAFVLRVLGPDDPEKPRSIRLLKIGLANTPGAGLNAAIPPAFTIGEQAFSLPEFITAQSLPHPLGGPVSGRKVRDTGPDANRLVLVVMGDGFTAADLAAGMFTNQVNRFLNQFFNTSPWNSYSNVINVYEADLASNESGADYENAPPGSGGTLKDTYLNAQFWAGGVERCVYLNSTGITRAFAAADSLVGIGAWDKILVFVNSAKYGGCGGAVGVSSLHPSADEIQIHEFGHSFGGLADEYDYGIDSTNCVETTLRNVDCGAHLPNLKWSAWVDPGTPMPTPPTADYAGVVGAFEGALYQAQGIFRPMLDCKMRTLGTPFCAICQEAQVLKLFERVELAGGAIPASAAVEINSSLARVFAIDPIPIAGITYRWRLNGQDLAGETNASITLSKPGGAAPNAVLEVVVNHSTPLVRATSIQSQHVWNLTFADLPAITAGNAVVMEGNAGTNEVTVTFTLSSPASTNIFANFATQDGTATAGLDYLSATGQIMFPAGTTTAAVSFKVLGDSQLESDENFFVALTSPINAQLAQPEVMVTIYDDDHPPSVALASPTAGAIFLEGQSIPINVVATQPHGQVARVDILQNNSELTSLTQEPYATNWANPPLGFHELWAVATDAAGRSATSAPVQVTILAASGQPVQLVTLTNAWRFDATTNNYGPAWVFPNFDDHLWRGPSNAVFISGNFPVSGPKMTPISLSANGARLRAIYFRTHFAFNAASTAGITLIASNLVSDGAVFYLNGQEAGRLRMPAGSITRTNLALPGGTTTNFNVLQLNPADLVAGDNVLAVELHVSSDTDYTAAFGLSLNATVVLPPALHIARSAEFIVISWDATNATLQAAGALTGPWRDVTNAVSPHSLTLSEGEFYRLIVR